MMLTSTAAAASELEGVTFYSTKSEAQLFDETDEVRKPKELPFPIPVPTKEWKFEYYMVGRNTLYNWILGFCFVVFAACAFRAATIKWSAYSWRGYVGMACFMLFSVFVAELNRFGRFHAMISWCHLWRYVLLTSFMTLALTDFILLGISNVSEDCDWKEKNDSDCPPLNPDKDGIGPISVRIMTRTITILCGVVFVFSAFGYWEMLAYSSAHSTWVQSILYMTILGWIFTHVARCAEPPPPEEQREFNWSWHQPHSSQTIGNNIVKIMIFFVLFMVVMGTLVLAVFADAATASGGLGTGGAVVLFTIIAMIISITPLAPGSVIDVCAGFLFVTLFVKEEEWGVPLAFGVSLGLTIVLHFVGSCSQYFVGKMGFVQIWANFALPPEMLAASDSVLQTANWFKVGVVGQVFMDTANGLNQGRMNMDFCTQFWSEYASIPNAISLVGLGAVLAIPSLGETISDRYQWADDAIPLMLMCCSIWQMAASSWGAKELMSQAHKATYWCSLEKWTATQYFHKLGYTPTKEGWKKDIYELATLSRDNDELKENSENVTGLFAKVEHLQIQKTNAGKHKDLDTFVAYARHLCRPPRDPQKSRRRMQQAKRRAKQMKDVRLEHFAKVKPLLDGYVESELLVFGEKEEATPSFWDDIASKDWKRMCQQALVLLIYISGGASYSWIASDVSLSDAVQKGLNVLKTVPAGGWVVFAVFWCAVVFYYHFELAAACAEMNSLMRFIFVDKMASDSSWESVYPTPDYEPKAGSSGPRAEVQLEAVAVASEDIISDDERQLKVSATLSTPEIQLPSDTSADEIAKEDTDIGSEEVTALDTAVVDEILAMDLDTDETEVVVASSVE